MAYITIKGYCPVQKKNFEISAEIFDRAKKYIGRVDCNYVRNLNQCNQPQCPIVKESGYHQ